MRACTCTCICVFCVSLLLSVCLKKEQNFCRVGEPAGEIFLRLIKTCLVDVSTTDRKASV